MFDALWKRVILSSGNEKEAHVDTAGEVYRVEKCWHRLQHTTHYHTSSRSSFLFAFYFRSFIFTPPSPSSLHLFRHGSGPVWRKHVSRMCHPCKLLPAVQYDGGPHGPHVDHAKTQWADFAPCTNTRPQQVKHPTEFIRCYVMPSACFYIQIIGSNGYNWCNNLTSVIALVFWHRWPTVCWWRSVKVKEFI